MRTDEVEQASANEAGTFEEHELQEPVGNRGSRRFKLPTRAQLMRWAPFLGVILLGALLRYWNLGDKPLHHDESLHAYYSLHLLFDLSNWANCFNPQSNCYHYDPLLHGPFQFHFIALTYKISQLLGAPDNGVNTTTVRLLAATLGTALVGLPYFLRDYLGRLGAWFACVLLAVSPSMVYFSRFAREDIYMAFFTLLLVVALARYLRGRQMRWLVIAALAFSFSYATKEATFLTVAVFGSFVVGLIAWELGMRLPLRERARAEHPLTRWLPRTLAPVFLLVYVLVAGIAAKVLFGWLNYLSTYITGHQAASDAYVQGLENNTVAIVPWVGILLGIFVLVILGREMFGKPPQPGRRGLARWIDPSKQRVLDTLITMPWTHWFFALLAAWVVFLVLFTVLFTNIRGGIGDGIWKGIYYWIEQQQVARGGEPWYYYLLLIPLYEQIGVVFGLVGVVYCLLHPTRFRLFLVYWFVGNLFLYSWAAEKMPWLMIHITMPMLLLAAIAIKPLVVIVWAFLKERFASARVASTQMEPGGQGVLPPRRRVSVLGGSAAVLGLLAAVLLLIPTLDNMYQVTYIHEADSPHEMMVYVQTTFDVNKVMAKVDALDKKLYGGTHQLPIGLASDATWPLIWYLRDYPNVCLDYTGSCPGIGNNVPLVITGGDDIYGAEAKYGGPKGNYVYQQYHMRDQWDQGYMPPLCVPSKTNSCTEAQPYVGVGPWLWLSYGDNPPPGATFNAGLAAQRIWNWWWHRQAFGDTTGSYGMVLFIRKDLHMTP